MVEISNVHIYELRESIIACRNAMRTELPDYDDEQEFEQSLKRAISLAKSPSNSGHPNFLTGIRVAFDIKYPNYFSPELQRYHFVDIITSSSKMHRLSSIVSAKSFNKYVLPEVIEKVQQLADVFNADPSYENRIRLLSKEWYDKVQFTLFPTHGDKSVGTIFSIRIADRTFEKAVSFGRMSDFEVLLFNLYYTKAKIVLDVEEAEQVDTCLEG